MFDIFLEFLRSSPSTAYWVVLFGSMIEGEIIILGASALAAAGHLSIVKIGSIVFFGTLFVDQILYFVGHFMYKNPGRPLSERFPKLYRKSKRAVVLLKKYDVWFILMFRFVYGIRAISPVVIGLCGSTPLRFVPLNFIAALIWTTISCSLGYWLGDFLFDSETGVVVSGHMHRLQYIIVGLLIFIITSIFLYRWIIGRKNNKKLKILGVDKVVSQNVEKEFYESTHSRKL